MVVGVHQPPRHRVAIRNTRSHKVVVEILGREFKSILVPDCFLAYNHRDLADGLKQKCLGHLLNDLSELEETQTHGALGFARKVAAVLQQALSLKTERPNPSPDAFTQRAAALEAEMDALIDPRRCNIYCTGSGRICYCARSHC